MTKGRSSAFLVCFVVVVCVAFVLCKLADTETPEMLPVMFDLKPCDICGRDPYHGSLECWTQTPDGSMTICADCDHDIKLMQAIDDSVHPGY